MNIFRFILIFISIKYQRINRFYIYFNLLYMAINMTQPSVWGDSNTTYVIYVSIVYFLGSSFDFWGPTVFACI